MVEVIKKVIESVRNVMYCTCRGHIRGRLKRLQRCLSIPDLKEAEVKKCPNASGRSSNELILLDRVYHGKRDVSSQRISSGVETVKGPIRRRNRDKGPQRC